MNMIFVIVQKLYALEFSLKLIWLYVLSNTTLLPEWNERENLNESHCCNSSNYSSSAVTVLFYWRLVITQKNSSQFSTFPSKVIVLGPLSWRKMLSQNIVLCPVPTFLAFFPMLINWAIRYFSFNIMWPTYSNLNIS